LQYGKRAVFYPLIFLFLNAIVFYNINIAGQLGVPLRVLAIALLTVAFIAYMVRPEADKAAPGRQRALLGGYELIVAAGVLFAAELLLYVYICLIAPIDMAASKLIANGIFSAAFLSVLLFNGMIRVAVTSKQLGAVPRVAMLLVWWVPIANLVVLGKACKTVRDEYKFLRDKRLLNEARRGQAVCATRYPILMVHGVFFRDWKYFNYWGRIPKELTDNGAQVFYGNHNSALAVEQAGEQLKQRILEIIAETGCEKVHIIGHSKGGLDARYAVSCLGMDTHVASITTINTPHRGTPLAGKLLELAPDKLVSAVDKQYGRLFAKLGDDRCDFLGSVNGLTPEICAELNKIMPDRPGVLYQSVGSQMRAASSAGPPLNAGYAIIKPLGGDNDGLVCTDSMPWGQCLGIWSPTSKKGISHGDMIDLTRKNIPGFDVCELYVGLAGALKGQGL